MFYTLYPPSFAQFEPKLTPHNETVVHHILLYACGNASVLPTGINDCYGADPAFSLCSQVIAGWAVGGTVSSVMGRCMAKGVHVGQKGFSGWWETRVESMSNV